MSEQLTKTNDALSLSKGYKHTEVGWIPEDWELKCLGDIGQFLKGKGIKKDEVVYDGIPCVRYGELYTVYSNIIERTVSFITESTSKESIQLRYGDLLFAGSGETKEEIGKSAVILRNDTFAGGDIVIFRTRDVEFQFLGYLSNFNPIQKQKSLNGQGDAVVHIYSGGLSKVKIPLPPTLTEQKAIATALGDVDALISSLERLITKKKAIKQGAMQELLTPPQKGGKRLPEFSLPADKAGGEWVEKTLDSLLNFGSGQDYKHLGSGDIPVYGTGGVMTFVDDFLFDGESVGIGRKGTIDKPVYLTGKFWTVDTLFYTYNFVNCIPRFMFYKFLMIPWKEYNEASGVPSLNKNTLGKIEIILPPTTEEQQAIAQILSDMDLEIEALEAKKAKYQGIKQGMMQELLTGKTRLLKI